LFFPQFFKMSTLLQLKSVFTHAIQKALDDKSLSAEVQPCMQEQFGHYQCNSSLQLAKTFSLPPREIAQKIIASLQEEDAKMFERIDIAGPGFINLTLKPHFLSQRLHQTLEDPYLGIPRPKVKQRVIVEYSSPNIAKELHVGHLRSTIIGESLARIFSFLGHEVIQLNHVGDWGTQFGMLIAFMKAYHSKLLVNQTQLTLPELMQLYKDAKKKFDSDQEFKQKAHLEVVDLQARKKESIEIWEKICEISRLAIAKIYHLLDVNLIERGESFYQPFLHQMIEDLEMQGLLSISDGAKCIFMEGFNTKEGQPLPLIVQKSDGGFPYAATDLAAMKHRSYAEKADRIIVVVDQGQSLHFQMVHKAAVLAGYIDPNKNKFDHVGFGLVLGADGKKFKTRSGDTEKLIDLLNQGINEAKKIILEKNPEINAEELTHLSEIIGIGAIKYADLSTQRQKDYLFSYDRMLRFEGNTAVFLMYAYVRIQGIKRKSKKDLKEITKHERINLSHPSEVSLGYHLVRFPEILDQITQDLMPNRLTDYLFHLAEKFHAFFRDCRVTGSEEEGSRLLLCEVTGKVLKQGLFLLGLKTVDRM
jgi:arginyl-tRNA synthetase